MMPTPYAGGKWNPRNWSWRTITALLIAFGVTSPMVLRQMCLERVPDVELPFDVEDVFRPDVAPEEDAFVQYQVALDLLSKHQNNWSDDAVQRALGSKDAEWDERLDQWLLEVKDALAAYWVATEMEQARGPSTSVTAKTELPIHSACHALSEIAEMTAIRHDREGDVETSWLLHRANLRGSMHMERHGGLVCRKVAVAMRRNACRGLIRWSQNPRLTVEQLQAARDEISNVRDRRMSMIDIAKLDYLMMRNTWQSPHLTVERLSNKEHDPRHVFATTVVTAFLWTLGQPEIRMRLERQVLLNQADQLDRPKYQRRKCVGTGENVLFALGSTKSLPGQLDPVTLDRLSHQILINCGILGFNINKITICVLCDFDHFQLSAIDALLAAHQYQRVYGSFPETLAQLVPDFLEAVPYDPMAATEMPLRYRRDEIGEAIIWSVGSNGIDDDAHIVGNPRRDEGYRIRLNAQSVDQNQEPSLDTIPQKSDP